MSAFLLFWIVGTMQVFYTTPTFVQIANKQSSLLDAGVEMEGQCI